MVKADIIRSIEVKLGLSPQEASQQVEHILTLIKERLVATEPVLISGFGQWKVREKKPRIGRNPKTREEHKISSRNVVTFYPSNVWREEISQNASSSSPRSSYLSIDKEGTKAVRDATRTTNKNSRGSQGWRKTFTKTGESKSGAGRP